MKKVTSQLHAIAENPWFVSIAGLASIASFIWMMYEKLSDKSSVFSSIVFFISFVFLLIAYIYSIRVRVEITVLRDISRTFNQINHIYRDTLSEMFSGDAPTTDPVDLLAEERVTLLSVCQRVSNIFTRVIRHDCMITVKLFTIDDDNKKFASTYVRSQEKCDRDKIEMVKFSVGTAENTAFDEAVRPRTDGKPSHYFSPDLTKEAKNGYSNQRQHFQRYYRSTLVVPIRGKNHGKEGTDDEYDMIGYLCIDTLAANRLKDGFHLQMLSSLAGQMYNFMSLMRGRYTVLVG